MKFFHTADILLDQSFAAIGLPPAEGNRCRAHLHERAHDLFLRARRAQVDALFITGNLFDHERVTRTALNFLRETFAALDPMPVFICPGPADPAVEASPWRTEAWPPNVHLFLEGTWTARTLPDRPLTVHGFACTGKSPAWPDAPIAGPLAADHIHVALSPLPAGAGIPALPEGLAYLGLGGRTEGQSDLGATPPAWGPGPLVNFLPGDQSGGGHLEIEIAPDGTATVERIVDGPGYFGTIDVDCGAFSRGQELLDAVRGELRALAHAPLVRITLTGTLLRPIYGELDGIREALADERQTLQWRDRTWIGEDFEACARERNSLGAFVQRISAEIDDLPDGDLRAIRTRSRDLGLCACLGSPLPIRGLSGEYR